MSEKKVKKKESLPKSSNEGPTKPIAIQGYEGSFHQVAARKFFGKKVEILPCATFIDLIKEASDENNTAGGIMAI